MIMWDEDDNDIGYEDDNDIGYEDDNDIGYEDKGRIIMIRKGFMMIRKGLWG